MGVVIEAKEISQTPITDVGVKESGRASYMIILRRLDIVELSLTQNDRSSEYKGCRELQPWIIALVRDLLAVVSSYIPFGAMMQKFSDL